MARWPISAAAANKRPLAFVQKSGRLGILAYSLFFLLSLHFCACGCCAMSDISVTLVDDSSPLIAYTSGQWESVNDVSSRFDTFNDTLTLSDTVGSTAVFNFTGVSSGAQISGSYLIKI